MTCPMNNSGPQRTFWNTYAFNPFLADTGPGKAGYLGLSILMFMVAPFWGHILAYAFARMPFKAKEREFMTEVEASRARAVERVVAETDPLKRTETDETYKTLLEIEKAIAAESKELHAQLSSLTTKPLRERTKEDDENLAKITDAIKANMLKSMAIARQISEYERAPSPLSSMGGE